MYAIRCRSACSRYDSAWKRPLRMVVAPHRRKKLRLIRPRAWNKGEMHSVA